MRWHRRYLLAISMLITGINSVNAQHEAGKVYGGAQNEEGHSICLLKDGNYVVAGRTRSEGEGANDIWLLKINPVDGRMIWSRTFGSEFLEQGHWVEPTADGGMAVMGYSNGLKPRAGRHDYLLLKLDADGNEEWSRMYGGKNRDIGFCVQEAHGGGYIMLGYSKSGNLRGDIWLVRADSKGEKVWDKLFGSPFVDYGHQIIKTEDHAYLMVGSESGFYYPSSLDHARDHADIILIKIDSAGNELWRQTYGGRRHELGRSLHLAVDGGCYLFGSTQSQGAGSFDQFLLKVDENGDSLWSRTYGGPGWDYGTSMDVDAEGNLYLLGTTNSYGRDESPDIWLHKTDPDGNTLWSMTLGGKESDHGSAVKALPEGGCMLVGQTRSYGAGKQDVFLARVTTNGRIDYLDRGRTWNTATIYPLLPHELREPEVVLDQVAFAWKVFAHCGRITVTQTLETGARTIRRDEQQQRDVYLYEIWLGDARRMGGRIVVD